MNEERELKALIGSEFEMPDVGDLFGSSGPGVTVVRSLSARYFDTDDLRLARWGSVNIRATLAAMFSGLAEM